MMLFEMQFLGRHHWERITQIKPHLISKYAARSGPGAVGFLDTVIKDMTKELKVLLHHHFVGAGKVIFKPVKLSTAC